MSYDIAIIDHRQRFNNSKEFLVWYDNAIAHQQGDYRQTSPALQQWFLKMKDRVRPLNGEFAPSDDDIDTGEFLEADYSFGRDFIYMALAQTEAEKTSALAFKLAKECHLTYIDISGTSELYNADGSHFQVSRQQAQYDVIKEKIQEENQRRNDISFYVALPLLLILLVCLFFIERWGLYVGIPTLAILIAFGFWSYRWIEDADKDVMKQYRQQTQEPPRWQVNKILWPPIIAIGISLPVIVFALIEHSVNSLVALGIWMVLLLFVLWKSMDNFWLYRRLPVMTPRHYKTVKVELDNREQTGDVFDIDSGISYRYNSKEKMFYLSKTMYTDPRRHPKEYEERKYQFETRMQQARIQIEGWISPSENSTICFNISVRLTKRNATPENIGKIRAVIVDLSKEDYNRRLFSKYVFGDNTLYLDTYHYTIVRAALVASDGSVERYSPQEASVKPSEQLAGIFEHIREDGLMDELQPKDLVEAGEFERIWNSGF